MSTTFRFYRGLEIEPLVYPHHPTEPGFGHNYEEGFNAAVRIRDAQDAADTPSSRVFELAVDRPFSNAGDARRASVAYAERLIDACSPNETVLDKKFEIGVV